jgi:PAS domain S-box-containing protein
LVVDLSELSSVNEDRAIRILHVEDEPLIQETTKLLLLDLDHSFEIDQASCVDEAFKKLSTKQYDVVISDYEMPQKNGLQFLKELREQKNEIPFILFTGKGREEVAIQALNLGADRYFTKQGNPETVYGELKHGIIQVANQNKLGRKLCAEMDRFKQLFTNTPMAIAIYGVVNDGEDFVFKDLNSAAEKIEKVEKRFVLGKPVTEVFPGVKEFGLFDVFKRVWKTGQAEHLPASLYRDSMDIGSWRENWVIKLPNKNIAAIYNDITEHKKIDLVLKETNELLKKVGESVDAGLALIGKDYRVIWANKRLMDLGVTPNKKCYQTFNNSEVICPDCGARRIFEQNALFDTHEFRTVNSKGETIWIELRVTPLKDSNGVTMAALELAVPITERKKTEEILRENEQRYRELVNHLPEIVFESDLTGNLEFANIRAEEMSGYPLGEIEKGVNLLQFIAPEDRERALKNVQLLLAGGHVVPTEYKFLRKDGITFPALVTATPRVSNNKVTGLRGLVFDISESKKTEEVLKESEKRYRAIVANAPIGIVTSGPNKYFLSANDAFCRILGYSEDELRKLTFRDLTFKADLRESTIKMSELENDAISSFTLEKRYVRKDGSIIDGRIMVNAVRDQNGKPCLFIAELEDITERKKVEERRQALERKVNEYSKNLKYLVGLRTAQLKDANERLLKNERLAAIGELAGMVGHDLRNPLTSIKNAAYFLKKKGAAISETQNTEMLEIIDKAVSHSDRIINDLLDYSREMHLQFIKNNARKLVAEALEMIQIPERIQINNNIQEETWIWVNPDQIARVFINLIKNAIEAIPEKGKIDLSSCQTKDNVEITFADTGPGIPEEIMQKIFTPLFTTKAQGMGFGLAICKRIVEAHQGTVSVQTVLNEGTTFTVTLPHNPKVDAESKIPAQNL